MFAFHRNGNDVDDDDDDDAIMLMKKCKLLKHSGFNTVEIENTVHTYRYSIYWHKQKETREEKKTRQLSSNTKGTFIFAHCVYMIWTSEMQKKIQREMNKWNQMKWQFRSQRQCDDELASTLKYNILKYSSLE